MFYEIRRKDKIIDSEAAKDILSKGEYGILSTVGENGYPYGVPVNYAFSDGYIFFHCAVTGHKLNNISFNNKVCFTVVGDTCVVGEKLTTAYESVIAFGTAQSLDGDEKRDALRMLVNKYSSEYKEAGERSISNAFDSTGVYKITIEHITGKKNKG